MQKIKCKKGKCWDENDDKKKLRSTCEPDDLACNVEADILEEQLDE